ncbi:hypothetical protein A3860_09580 [Niastella vici]|uniref:Outer membrane protein beta-barrel domain-containing protein n=1 Tax=Niastella vici TaxID=1703345 RepID=A0A1V9FEP5_9BACT|nr:outer membrane beta-barrel protein [Niastella vici]OQP56825.1 hypothetical protein A3860_09580 [Niastella vici]
MRKLPVLFALITISCPLFAQRIGGVVSDAATRQPLAWVTISVLKATDTTSLVKGTLAAENGSYLLDHLKPGNYLLAAQMMGYARQLIPVELATTDTTINIRLTAETKQLVVVTVRASKPLVEHRPDKLVFNIENSIVAAGNDALELLKMTPMVMVSANNSIRLKGKDNVLVMLDGKIVPGETLADVLQSMSPEQISKIELVTTPSASSDASATGGIINIITKKGTGRGLNGLVNASAVESRYGKYNGGISLNYRREKINVYSTVNGRDGKAYKNEEITRALNAGNGLLQTLEMPTELFRNARATTGKLGVDYTLNPSNTIGLSVDGIFSRSNNNAIAVSSFKNDTNDADSILTSKSRPANNTNYTNYDLYFKSKLNARGDQLALDLNQTHFNSDTRQIVNTTIVDVKGGTPDRYASSFNSTRAIIDITNAQADYSLTIKPGFSLGTGCKDVFTRSANRSANEQENGLNPEPAQNETSYKENIFAGYLVLTRQLKTVRVQAGLRAEHTNAWLSSTGLHSSYLDWFPSALVSKKITDKYQVTLSYTCRINRPAYKALIPFVIPIDRYSQEKGNPGLKPEYTNSFELVNSIGKMIFTLAYTHTRDAIADFIEQDPQTRIWTFTKGNFSRRENVDGTLVLPVTIARWFTTDNTLQGFYSSFADKSGKVGGADYDQGKFSCTINSINTFSLPLNLKADLTAIYNSAYIDGLYQISGSSMINVGLSRAFFERKLNAKLAVNDIFHNGGYHLSSGTGSIHLTGHQYTDSRQFVLAVSYKFGKTASPNSRGGNEDAKGRLNL